MKSLFTIFALSISFLSYSMEYQWQESWLLGLECLDRNEYDHARDFLEDAVAKMSGEELQQAPEVLIQLAQAHYMLGSTENTLLFTEQVLKNYSISDHQKLVCGQLIVSSLWKAGRTQEAQNAYSTYIVNSLLAPKCHFQEDKIIISNITAGCCYNKSLQSILIDEFCNNQNDFHELNDVWVINVTKRNCCYSHSDAIRYSKRPDPQKSAEAIRGCCNTCSTLAVGAAVICSRIPHLVCSAACVLFIEALRQVCEACCFHGGFKECWDKFAFWKDEYHDKNPRCPHPNEYP